MTDKQTPPDWVLIEAMALDIAEKQLRNDKRRRVGRVVYGKAIQA